MENTQNKNYKYCIVPLCKNTTISTPDKRFFTVPKKKTIREEWCKIMKRDPLKEATTGFVCEDHFDVETDTKNFIKHKLMGCGLLLKQDVIPHKFACQTAKCPQMGSVSMKRLRIDSSELSTEDQASVTQQTIKTEDPTIEGIEFQNVDIEVENKKEFKDQGTQVYLDSCGELLLTEDPVFGEPTEFTDCDSDDETKKSIFEPEKCLYMEIRDKSKVKTKDRGTQIKLPFQKFRMWPLVKARHISLTSEERLKFVRKIVKHKHLITDSKRENKPRKRIKQIALIEISKKMNIPGFGPREVYTKIRGIKHQYFHELKKTMNEAAAGRKYFSKIVWFDTMDNAMKALKEEEMALCLKNEPESPSEMDEETSHSEDEQQSINMQFYKEEDDSDYLEYEEQTNTDNETETKDNIEHNIDENATPHDIENINNEFHNFGQSVAAHLKNMTLQDALEAQMFIQNYLSNLRLGNVRRLILE